VLSDHALTVESCDDREREMREWPQSKIGAENGKIRALEERIVNATQSYRSRYLLENREADPIVDAAGEYRVLAYKGA
jgi:uncharacterized protein YPO0396